MRLLQGNLFKRLEVTIITITELREDIIQKARELTDNFISDNEHRILRVTNKEIFIPHKYGFIEAGRIDKHHNLEEHIHVHIRISKDGNGKLVAEEILLIRNIIHLIYQYWIQYTKIRNLKGFFFVYSNDFLSASEVQSNDILKANEFLLPKNPDILIDRFMNEYIDRQGFISKWVYLGGIFSKSFEKKIRTFLKLQRILESYINETPDMNYCTPSMSISKEGKFEFGVFNMVEYKNLLMHLSIIEETNQLNIDYIDNQVDYIPYKTGEIDQLAKEYNVKNIPIDQESLHQWTEILDNYLVPMANTNK